MLIIILTLSGGISMGGGLALHLGYRFHQDVAGVFALSSFLNKDSTVYQVIPSIFQVHTEYERKCFH